MTAEKLQSIIWEKLGDKLVELKTDRCYLGLSVGATNSYDKGKFSLNIVWSSGVQYHTDNVGITYTNILTLYNPGYGFKVKTKNGLVVLRNPKYFSFKFLDRHCLFWNSDYQRKSRRENWIGLCVHTDRSLKFSEFSKIVLKCLEDKVCLTKLSP